MVKGKKENRTRIGIEKDTLKELKKLCVAKDVTLEGFFKRVVLYPDLTEKLLSFPDEVSMEMLLDTSTVTKHLPLWMDNLRGNFAAVKDGKDIRELPDGKNTPALIIGKGPSLEKKKHLDLITEKGFNGTIFAADSVLEECLEHEIVPDYVMFVDGSDKLLQYIDHKIVDEYADKLTAIMDVVVHPSVVNRWPGDIYWQLTYIEDLYGPNITHMMQLLTHRTAMASGGHCSSMGWSIAALKGFKPVVLIGLDLSFPADLPIEKTRKAYEFYLNTVFNGDKEQTLKVFDNHYHHSFFNTDCYYELIFGAYTNVAKQQFATASKHGLKVINCSEGGTLEGEGIECMWFKDYLDSDMNSNRKNK